MSAIPLKISTASALSLLLLATDAASAQEFQTALQVSPAGGGRCIEVPGGAFVQDQGLQIRYGSTEKGAPLQSWTCGEAEPNQLWRLQRK